MASISSLSALLNSPGLARRSLAALPTPLEPAPTLAAALGLSALACKRDDLSGNVYGGNKVRKLEYLLGDALARGCDTVITFGAIGSNHALATSLYARECGLRCHAVLTPQVKTPYVADTLRWHVVAGTCLHGAADYADTLRITDEVRRAHPTGPDRLGHITWGGSSWRGALGFVRAALEFSGQFPPAAGAPCIYLPCGTVGSVAGLALGLRLAGVAATVVGVKVVPNPAVSNERLAEFIATLNRELHRLDASVPILDEPLQNTRLRTEFLGPGYAEATPEALEALALARDCAGLKLETTYSAKAMAALIADARSGMLQNRQPVFWNTYNSRPAPPAIRQVTARDLPTSLQQYLSA